MTIKITTTLCKMLLLFFSLTFSLSSYAKCDANYYSYIVNKSDSPWYFIFNSANVRFLPNYTSCDRRDTPCVIPPHSTVTFTYNDYARPSGLVTITSSNKNSDGVITKEYSYGGAHKESYDGCGNPYIYHYDESRTGGVTLNESAWGSFVIERDTW